MRDWHIFMSQLLEIFKVFDNLTLKQIFWKMQTLFIKLEYFFLVPIIRLKMQHFHTKLLCQKPMLRQTKRGVQYRPIIKTGVLPVTTLFFRKFCFSLRTSYKKLIWCSNHPNAHIHTFRKRWSFIWVCYFPVSILKGTLMQI